MVYQTHLEQGQIWESRHIRGDGTRERVLIIKLTGREARVRSQNPRPGKPLERTIAVGTGCGRLQLAGMRLVVLADGTPFEV